MKQMPMLGALIDIDGLGGGPYWYAAYKISFDAIDTVEALGALEDDYSPVRSRAAETRQRFETTDVGLEFSRHTRGHGLVK